MAHHGWTAALGPPAPVAALLVLSAVVLDPSNLLARPAGAGGPQDPNYMARMEDGRIDTRYLATENRTEVSLSLIPPRPGGGPGISLVIGARFAGREPTPGQPVGLSLRAHYGLHSDDAHRTVLAMTATSHALEMAVDAEARDGGIRLFFYPQSWGYSGFTGPGDEIPVAFFSLSEADLRAMAAAHSLSGSVLWTDFVLTRDEITALARFASMVLPARHSATAR